MDTHPDTASDIAIEIAHAMPGRTRLRIRGGKLDTDVATRLADAVAAQPGMERVEIDIRTGSALCSHTTTTDAAVVLKAAQVSLAKLGPAAVPKPAPVQNGGTTAIARELTKFFQDANRDLLAATEGRLDIGTAATLSFLGAGALQVVARQELPAPPWFNLAWWGFRTFMTFEAGAIQPHSRNQGGKQS
jgi:heavy-metal-associated domain-containing protein